MLCINYIYRSIYIYIYIYPIYYFTIHCLSDLIFLTNRPMTGMVINNSYGVPLFTSHKDYTTLLTSFVGLCSLLGKYCCSGVDTSSRDSTPSAVDLVHGHTIAPGSDMLLWKKLCPIGRSWPSCRDNPR